MIVIDVGCARYGGDYSIERLVDAFEGRAPEIIYGCDPSSAMDELMSFYRDNPLVVTELRLAKAAAWTYDGEIGFLEDGLNSCLTLRDDVPKVECFDLAEFIRSLPADKEIVLKLDAEGSEYELLRHLIATRTDELLKLVWVEWHCLTCGRGGGLHREGCSDRTAGAAAQVAIEEEIDCELTEWGW